MSEGQEIEMGFLMSDILGFDLDVVTCGVLGPIQVGLSCQAGRKSRATGSGPDCCWEIPIASANGENFPSFQRPEEFSILYYTSGSQCPTARVTKDFLKNTFSPRGFIAEIGEEGSSVVVKTTKDGSREDKSRHQLAVQGI